MENMNFNIRSNNTNFSNLENLELKKTDEGTLENEPVSIFNGNTETIETIDNLSLNKPMENTEQEIPEEGDEDLNVGENDGINTYEKVPPEEEDDSITDKTDERIKEERKANLSEGELSVYEKFETMLEGLDDSDIKGDEIFDFIEELSDEEVKDLLSAYDYVNSNEGGIEELFTELYDTLLSHEGRDSQMETFTRIAEFLGEEDKQKIIEHFREACAQKAEEQGETNESLQEAYEKFYNDVQVKALEKLLNGERDEAEDILNEEYSLTYQPNQKQGILNFLMPITFKINGWGELDTSNAKPIYKNPKDSPEGGIKKPILKQNQNDINEIKNPKLYQNQNDIIRKSQF